MKRRRRVSADPPTAESDWLDAATERRRRRDQAFRQGVEQLHQRRDAWAPQDVARTQVRSVRPLRG